MNRPSIDARRSIAIAWRIFKQRSALFVGILLAILGAWLILELIVITGQRAGIVLWVVAHSAFLLFLAGVEVGFLRICLGLFDGRDIAFGDAFRHLALGPKFLVGQLSYLLAVGLGLVLLIIPGVYLGVQYALFGFCLVDGETNPLRSFQRSSQLTAGVRSGLLATLVFLLALNVLGASLLGLGLFVTIPLSALTMTHAYRQLTCPIVGTAA